MTNKIRNPILTDLVKNYGPDSISHPHHNKGSHTNHSRGGGGGCYLTTVCVGAMNLPDNCLELNVLRGFRDNVLSTTSEGRQAVKEYYKIAPEIVGAVNKQRREESTTVWRALYGDVRKAVTLVISGRFNEAFEHYKGMTLELRQKYLK